MEAPTSSSGQLPGPWQAWTEAAVTELRGRKLLRTLRPVIPTTTTVDAYMHVDDVAAWLGDTPPTGLTTAAAPAADLSRLRLFSLNDYLGLSSHPDVCRAAAEAAMQVGMGPRSSALVGGYTAMHRDLETALADLKGTEECLLFPTGFAANTAAMAALAADPDAVIFSDELNHASIIDGARLAARAGGRLVVYRHRDLAHLESLLASCPPSCRKLIVTDSLFSMDGDFADLRGLAVLKRRHGALLVVDEAHATLVCGERGGGGAEAQGVCGDVDLHVGTLSKAFGSLGGFVATSRDMKHLLTNRGRPVVYSTALPLPVVAAAQAALAASQREAWRRQHLWGLVDQLGDGLGVRAESPIIPLVVGAEATALSLAGQLLRKGFHVPAIRPPTVPAGTCRLRVSLSAAHSRADVDDLIAAVRDCGATFVDPLKVQADSALRAPPLSKL